MRIQLKFAESSDPLEELLGGQITLNEVIEGRQEFLDELDSRLQAITCREPVWRVFDRNVSNADATLPLRNRNGR